MILSRKDQSKTHTHTLTTKGYLFVRQETEDIFEEREVGLAFFLFHFECLDNFETSFARVRTIVFVRLLFVERAAPRAAEYFELALHLPRRTTYGMVRANTEVNGKNAQVNVSTAIHIYVGLICLKWNQELYVYLPFGEADSFLFESNIFLIFCGWVWFFKSFDSSKKQESWLFENKSFFWK